MAFFLSLKANYKEPRCVTNPNERRDLFPGVNPNFQGNMIQKKLMPWFLLVGFTCAISLLSCFTKGIRNDPSKVTEKHPLSNEHPEPLISFTSEDHFASLLSKLRKWGATTNPSVREALEHELEALLNNVDAADIFRRLPMEFQESPLGVKALERWVKCAPLEAVDWLAKSPSVSDAQVEVAMHSWINSDMDSLRHYLANAPASDWKQRVLATAADEALASDKPEDTIEWLTQLMPGNFKLDMMDSAAQAWAEKDLEAAVNWANTQASEWRERLLADITVGIAQKDPASAINFARNNLLDGDDISRAVQGIVSTWSVSDPSSAANWVALIPQGDDRANALKLLLYAWSSRDSSSAQQWISTKLVGVERDQAFAQLTAQSSQGDFATAAKLVTQISPGQVQNDLGAGIVRRWAVQDFGQASAWVNSLPADAFRQLTLSELAKTAERRADP